MTTFVIVKKNVNFVDTPVFYAGEKDEQEAVPVFTSQTTAESYLNATPWGDQYEVGELDAAQTVRFLANALEDGVELILIDPVREEHISGETQRVLHLRDKLTEVGAILNGEFNRFARAAE